MSQIPLTIFDLVEPRSLHKLYGMLALALDEDVFIQQEASADSGEDDFNSRSHMSIILPTKKFRHTSINYEMTVSLVLMNTSFTVWFFSHFLLSTFNIQRSYSWNTLCLEREAFSGGSRQPHRFQILHLFQVVLVYHLKMIFCPIVINREEIFCQEARSFVCWTVFCVSSCVEKSTNHLHVVVFQIPVSYIS